MNKFKQRRKAQILDGICDLINLNHEEFGIVVEDVVEHFKFNYKPKAVRASEKRQQQRSKVRRHQVAKQAVETRWERQREFLAAPTAKEKAEAKVVAPLPKLAEKPAVEVPDLI